MFRRRRMFQRNPLAGAQFRRNPLAAAKLQQLMQANQLMREGKPLEAGAIFSQIADDLNRSNHPRLAANVYTRAAHAYVDGSDTEAALGSARQALMLFTQQGLDDRASMFNANITRKMSGKGMNAAVEKLQQEFGARSAAGPNFSRQASQPQRGMLPTNCPRCGAPLDQEDITWINENTFECGYCGSRVRSE